MIIELEVSDKNEGTSEPWWIIIDPSQNMKLSIDVAAGQITGPFFSREEAESCLKNRSYRYSDKAKVYCMSGYDTSHYKNSIRIAREDKSPEPIIIPTESPLTRSEYSSSWNLFGSCRK